MVVFDKRTLRILKYIHNRSKKGVTWATLQKKFGEDDANTFLLEALNKEQYLATKDIKEQWIDFDQPQLIMDSRFVSFATPKANEMIERKCYNFWKWMIPTFISVVALFISILALFK